MDAYASVHEKLRRSDYSIHVLYYFQAINGIKSDLIKPTKGYLTTIPTLIDRNDVFP